MLQVIRKWHVEVILQDGKTITFWVSDNFLSNVLRTVASLDFCGGIEQPASLLIEEEVVTPNVTTSTT